MRPTPSLIPRLISYVPHAPHAPYAPASAKAYALAYPLVRPYQYASLVDGGAIIHDVEGEQEQARDVKWDRLEASGNGKEGHCGEEMHLAAPQPPRNNPIFNAFNALSPTAHPSAQGGSAPPSSSSSSPGTGSEFLSGWSGRSHYPYVASTNPSHSSNDASSSPTDHRIYSTPDGRTSTVPAPTLAWCDFLSMV